MNTLTLNPNPDLKITMITSTHNSSTHIPYMMQQSTILKVQFCLHKGFAEYRVVYIC